MCKKASCHLAGIDGVEKDAFCPCHQQNGVETGFGSIAIATANKFVVYLGWPARTSRVAVEQATKFVPPLFHALVTTLAFPVNADSNYGTLDAFFPQGEEQRGEDAAGAKWRVDGVELKLLFGYLLRDLQPAAHIAQATMGSCATDRNIMRIAALGT